MTTNFRDEIAKDMKESGFNVHDNLKDLTVPELRKLCDHDRNPFVMSAINVTGDMNMGSLIRTACLFGAQKFIVFGRKKFDRRGLVGANNYIDIDFVPCLNDDLTIDPQPIIEKLSAETLQPIFIEQGGLELGSFHWFYAIEPKGTPCLIVGNENRGVPDNVIDAVFNKEHSLLAPLTVSIPQKGVIRSHNVSVAAGIVMSSMCFQMW
jgi:tRNA G18 (ribose-2'-O)-methylase SpoU